MAYHYQDLRPRLFTDEGQRDLLKTRDLAFALTDKAGAVRSDKLMIVSDTWLALACMDRLVEVGDVREITADHNVAGQDRIFVRVRRTA